LGFRNHLCRHHLLTFQAKSFQLTACASIASLSAQQLRRAADIKDQVQTLETELA
jgi:hypothetical protein